MHSETISSIMAINFQLHQSTPFTKWQRILCLLIGIIEDAWPYGRGTLSMLFCSSTFIGLFPVDWFLLLYSFFGIFGIL